jgi:Protein-tyrosine phosphatase
MSKSNDYGTAFDRSRSDFGTGSTTFTSNNHSSHGPNHHILGVRSSPTKAFSFDGVEYWGSPFSSLDDISMTDKDLLINAYGTPHVAKPFIRSAPKWLNMKGHDIYKEFHQIVLEWKDFSPPPSSANIDFWEAIIAQAKEEGIKRIICCCMAGLGRTGTALASLALASGYKQTPLEAIAAVRNEYNKKAIETTKQELYIWQLLFDEQEIIRNGFYREEERVEVKPPTNLVRRGISFEEDDDDDKDHSRWSNWTRSNPKTSK